MKEKKLENKYTKDTIEFFKKCKKHNISEYTAQCAYYTILSFIPFIILLLTLIQYINISQDTLVLAIKSFIPNTMNDKILSIVQEIYSKSFGTISISAIITLWLSGRGFYALCKGFHVAYEIPKKRGYLYFKLKGIVCTVLFLFVIIFVLFLMVLGGYISEKLSSNFENLSFVLNNIVKISNIGLVAILFLIFLLMYKFIPNHKVKLKKQIPGAIFASVAWTVVSYGFGLYIKIFTGFSIMYGSLTVIILLMMWVYANIYIVLFGAEINSSIKWKTCEKQLK